MESTLSMLHKLQSTNIFIVIAILFLAALMEVSYSESSKNQLTIEVDKRIYVQGENIIIRGKVPVVAENSKVSLDIVDPPHSYQFRWETAPNPDGTYEYKVRVEDVLFGASTRCMNNKVYTIEATYTIDSTTSDLKAYTTFEIEIPDHIPYARWSHIANFPNFFWKEDTLQYNVLQYVFFDEAPCNFVAIFQIIDQQGYTYQIRQITIDTSNSYIATFSDSAYDPPILGVELGSSYLDEIFINDVGNYTLKVYSWTNLEHPVPLADVITQDFTVVQRTSFVSKGDITLSIATQQVSYGARQNVTLILNAINIGDTDLIVRGKNHQSPMRISLHVHHKGYVEDPVHQDINASVEPYTKSVHCILYNELTKKAISITSETLILPSRNSIVLNCEYSFVEGTADTSGLHLRASGTLVGLLEPWDETKYGKKVESETTILSTGNIDFDKGLFEFIPPLCHHLGG